MCIDFGWDRDGDSLAMISINSTTLFLWDSNTHRKHQLDSGLRDPLSCVLWSRNGHTLAIATAKGNLCIYNHATSRRIQILGKHSKAIICGMWNSENLLALGSEDRSISISNIEGDTLRIITLRAEPSLILFSEMKIRRKISGRKYKPDNPVELAFQTSYGNIVSYECIKVHELGSLPETVAVVHIEDDETIEKLAWSEDGQLLGSSHELRINNVQVFLWKTDMEPSFLSIGPSHLAVGMNNRAWFYDLGDNSPELSHTKPNSSLEPPKLLFDKEYLGNISNICLNTEYASVLFEGRIFLHQIDMGNSNEIDNNEVKLFSRRNRTLQNNQSLANQRVNDTATQIPQFPAGAMGGLWEMMPSDGHIFIIYDSKMIHTYVARVEYGQKWMMMMDDDDDDDKL
ncbi:hypothetical protein ACFE04_011138 [Oxalis oulophora]